MRAWPSFAAALGHRKETTMRNLISRILAGALVAAGLAVAAAVAPAEAVPALAAGAAARTAAPGGTWGTATEVPGLAALNAGGSAQISSMSCATVGNCGASGTYTDGAGNLRAFVVSQAYGRWGTATPVPGLAALNTGGNSQIAFGALSCASAGNCSAGGTYTLARTNSDRAFVVSEQNGRWGRARTVTGAGANGPGMDIVALSCSSAGNCSAGGFYAENSSQTVLPEQAFVVNQTGGIWGKAKEVPGTAALNAGGEARVNAVSCGSAGNCSAGGSYTDRSGHEQAFVVRETAGTWGKAEQVAGTAALNAGGLAQLDALSCVSAGNCTGTGAYLDRSRHLHGFAVTENKGSWGTAEQMPRSVGLNVGAQAAPGFGSLSCATAGNCSAGGSYSGRSGRHFQVFAVSRNAGRWGTAGPLPGAAALNAGRNADINSLSCGAAGNCSTGGNYTDSSRHWQAFVASQAHGNWGTAQQVPGTAALNAGHFAATYAVSCASAGHCSAGGFYTDRSGHQQAFVVSRR
jgi:hypothetical protein